MRVLRDESLAATMRDGTVLRADAYHPDAPGKYPVLLSRTPYNKDRENHQELCYGILRARYRESFDRPTLIQPGRAYEYTIQLNPTSNQFKPGHRIRVDISSSDFPNFDRNHNTGGDDYAEATLLSAKQTIFHDAGHPSRLVLPVIP